jgi:hypothetical protein
MFLVIGFRFFKVSGRKDCQPSGKDQPSKSMALGLSELVEEYL